VLLDINNIYVSASNQRRDAGDELALWCQALDRASVGEFHLAGHALVTTTAGDELRIDDHGARVCAEVWSLYETAIAHFGARPTLIEWDTRLPDFSLLQDEAARAQQRLDIQSALAGGHPVRARAHAAHV
jgi:uncharacterized protein (UPF0276 family)